MCLIYLLPAQTSVFALLRFPPFFLDVSFRTLTIFLPHIFPFPSLPGPRTSLLLHKDPLPPLPFHLPAPFTMHVHLTAPDKEAACLAEIQALHACHEAGFIAKYLGACNDVNKALNMCLRQERLARTAKNRESAKERTEKKKIRWEQLEKEE